MGLNLGLEGLVVPEAKEVEVSNEELLRSTLSASVAQNRMDKAFRDLHELLRNAANYTEILNSLQKHSSNECLAYASELLNQNISSTEDAKAIVKNAISTAGSKIAQAAVAAGKTMKEWLLTLVKWCSDLMQKVRKSIHEKAEAKRNAQDEENIAKARAIFHTKPKVATMEAATDIMQAMMNNGFSRQQEMSKLVTCLRETGTEDINSKSEAVNYLRAAKDVFSTGARWVSGAIKKIAESAQFKACMAILKSFCEKLKNGIMAAVKWILKNGGEAAVKASESI